MPSSAVRRERFQSTLPIRGATNLKLTNMSIKANFNPRSPYGERRFRIYFYTSCRLFQSTLPIRGATNRLVSRVSSAKISIHAPHTGSDGIQFEHQNRTNKFQSTLPIRGATLATVSGLTSGTKISIHAPHTGSDPCRPRLVPRPRDFNPRSPYGERQMDQLIMRFRLRFQSTLPIRGATDLKNKHRQALDISIHAPHTGSDDLATI